MVITTSLQLWLLHFWLLKFWFFDLLTELNNQTFGLFFKKEFGVFYYMNYGLFENVPMLTLSLKDSLLDLKLTAQFFFFFLQNPVDFVLPHSGIDHKICVDFFKGPDISPVSDCFFWLETHEGLSSHLCFNNFSMIYLIVIIVSFLFGTICTHYIWRFKSHGKLSGN